MFVFFPYLKNLFLDEAASRQKHTAYYLLPNRRSSFDAEQTLCFTNAFFTTVESDGKWRAPRFTGTGIKLNTGKVLRILHEGLLL